MNKLVLGVLASFVLVSTSYADIYLSTGPLVIADSATSTNTITVSNLQSPKLFRLNAVQLTFGPAHTWVGDLTISLLAPTGENVQLFRRIGATSATSLGDSSNLLGVYTFVDIANGGVGASFAAAAAAVGGSANVATGTYQRTSISLQATPAADPDNYNIFNAKNINGLWTLSVTDSASGDVGTISAWRLDITSIPEPSTSVLIGLLSLLGLVGLQMRKRRRSSLAVVVR